MGTNKKEYSSEYYAKNRKKILGKQKVKNALLKLRRNDIKKLSADELLRVVGYE